jgi:hypothetical protein
VAFGGVNSGATLVFVRDVEFYDLAALLAKVRQFIEIRPSRDYVKTLVI